MKNELTILILISTAVIFRTVWHLGPNFELVTAASLTAGYFIKNNKLKFFVPIAIMFISDSIIGNSLIFLFTWSAYLLTPLLGGTLRKFAHRNLMFKFILSELTGIFSVVIFFLWTNFGVVITTNMYPKSIEGLIASYINGLPFIKPQLFSVLLTTPVIFTLIYLQRRYTPHLKLNLTEKLTQIFQKYKTL